jgi:diketogulonate reductase-like aldo/keto reductase
MQGVQCIAYRTEPPVGGDAKKAVDQVSEALGKPTSAVLAKWSTQRGVPAVIPSVAAVESVDKFFAWKLNEEQDKVRIRKAAALHCHHEDFKAASLLGHTWPSSRYLMS